MDWFKEQDKLMKDGYEIMTCVDTIYDSLGPRYWGGGTSYDSHAFIEKDGYELKTYHWITGSIRDEKKDITDDLKSCELTEEKIFVSKTEMFKYIITDRDELLEVCEKYLTESEYTECLDFVYDMLRKGNE